MNDFNILMERYVRNKYSFQLDDQTISVKIEPTPKPTNPNGYTLLVSNHDRTILSEWFGSPTQFKLSQYKFWSIFGVPLIFHYKELNVITDYTIKHNHHLFFFPPVIAERTEWDITGGCYDYYK